MRILAVDDDPIILDLLRTALAEQDNLELTCSASVEEATEIMENQTDTFDCFLLDIKLPGRDGIEFCEMLRASHEHRSTPIIMITGSREPDLMSRAFKMGATDFVSKPLDGVELTARINTAAMLNDSLLREREAQHTLAELTAQARIPFGMPMVLETDGVTDVVAMENDLLRLPGGCYAMNFFSVDVIGMRDVHQNVSPRAFRSQIEQVGSAIVAAMWGRPSNLAYLGAGRFAGVLIHRSRLDVDVLSSAMNEFLSARWYTALTESDTAPRLEVRKLSDQRLWSGRSASDFVHNTLRTKEIIEMPVPVKEENIFTEVAAMAG